MEKITLAEFEDAMATVHAVMQPTAQHHWPLLSQRTGAEVWVKHENHTPCGAFKVRGGIVYMSDLARNNPNLKGVISATRGNHGQSVALAAKRVGLEPVVVVPHGNSVEKNAAMRSQGAEVIVHGEDFQDALEHSRAVAQERELHMVESFHPLLVRGVGTYAIELLQGVEDLDTIYAPIGLGSGICGVVAARDALGLSTKIVGVVAEKAPAYALSFDQRQLVSTNTAGTMADGMDCRVPIAAALDMIWEGVDRVIALSEAEIKAAMRHYFTDTHNVAEGAGAAPLGALLREREAMAGRKVGLILSGGNVDRTVYQAVLQEADALEGSSA